MVSAAFLVLGWMVRRVYCAAGVVRLSLASVLLLTEPGKEAPPSCHGGWFETSPFTFQEFTKNLPRKLQVTVQ